MREFSKRDGQEKNVLKKRLDKIHRVRKSLTLRGREKNKIEIEKSRMR